MIEANDYFSFQNNYLKHSRYNDQLAIITINFNGQSKIIRYYDGDVTVPQALRAFVDATEHIAGLEQWIGTIRL